MSVIALNMRVDGKAHITVATDTHIHDNVVMNHDDTLNLTIDSVDKRYVMEVKITYRHNRKKGENPEKIVEDFIAKWRRSKFK
jgi:hypothetical protein